MDKILDEMVAACVDDPSLLAQIEAVAAYDRATREQADA